MWHLHPLNGYTSVHISPQSVPSCNTQCSDVSKSSPFESFAIFRGLHFYSASPSERVDGLNSTVWAVFFASGNKLHDRQQKMTAFSKHICMDLVVIQIKIFQLFERSKFKWKFSFQAVVGKMPGEAMSADEATNKIKEDKLAKVCKNKSQKN